MAISQTCFLISFPMACSTFRFLESLVLVVMLVVMAEATPPGIANNPSHATCKVKKYKQCYNLVHVCPKFCPDQCYVECASCKPICGSDPNPPPEDTPTPDTPSPPSPPSETYYSPPPPVVVTPSPPPSNPTPSYSPPLPSPPPVTPSPPPPTPSSPPPPSIGTPSTPPSVSSPPPVTSTPPSENPNPPASPPVNYPPSSPPPTNTNPPSTPPSSPTPPTLSPPPPVTSTPPPTTPPASPNPPANYPPSPPPPTNSNPPSNPTPPTISLPPPVNSTPPPANRTPPTSPPVDHPSSPPPPTNTNPPSTPPENSNPPTPSSPNSPSPTPPSENPHSPPTNTPPPAPSTPSPPPSTPTPPSSSAGAAKRVRCKNVNYPKCYNMIHTCPTACPNGCEVDCVTCKPVCHCDRPGAVCQDPRFIGGDGITFYFHGKKDKDFCLVSDPDLHINAHFIGKRNPSLKRDFTWVQSLAILFQTHRLFIAAQKTDVWDDSIDRLTITLDDNPVALPMNEGSRLHHPIDNPTVVIVRLAATNHVMVEAKGLFRIRAKVVPITKEDSRIHNYGIEEGDSFAHLDVGFKFFGLSEEVSGILGQTYGAGYVSRVNVKAAMAVMGRAEEFETSSLFATDCAVSRFGGSRGGIDGGDETI